jgi:hypothetical protein
MNIWKNIQKFGYLFNMIYENYEIIKTQNNGSILISDLVDKQSSDLEKVMDCCLFFANKGYQTEILPKIHFKNPLYKFFF